MQKEILPLADSEFALYAVTGVSLLFSGVTTILLFKVSNNKVAAEKAETRIRALEDKFLELRTQVSPVWLAAQSKMIEELHHPNPKYAEMDGLLEKLDNNTLLPPERARLKVLALLRAVDFDPEITDLQRASALILGSVMDKVVIEKEALKTTPALIETGKETDGNPDQVIR